MVVLLLLLLARSRLLPDSLFVFLFDRCIVYNPSDINEVLENCHPLGALGRVTERNIASFTPSKRGLENLFLTVLVATPVGHYFTNFLQVCMLLVSSMRWQPYVCLNMLFRRTHTCALRRFHAWRSSRQRCESCLDTHHLHDGWNRLCSQKTSRQWVETQWKSC